MKIRKNAKRSPLRYPAPCPNAGELVQTHHCKLNQSPWDVVNFSLPISAVPRRPPPLSQSSLQAVKREKINFGKKSSVENATIVESKANGKGWQCRRKATNETSLCEHHLSLIQTKKPVEAHDRSSNQTKKPIEIKKLVETHNHSSNQTKKPIETNQTKKPVNLTKKSVNQTKKSVNQTKKAVETHDPSRGKKEKALTSSVPHQYDETHDGSRGKKAIPLSGPDEFYYSSFGPIWGKIIGESSSENITRGGTSRNDEHGDGLSSALLSQLDDEDTESDDQIEIAAKVREKVMKRGRPPKKGQ